MIGSQNGPNFLNFYRTSKDRGLYYQKKQDEHELAQLRNQMVERQIKARGVRDPHVLDAMENVPRHKFIGNQPPASAYEDRPLPIGENQTISQPYIVALMTESLELKPNHSVLEIGTGSGYQAAVLAEIADHVYTIERHKSLQEKAKKILDQLGYDNISYRVGDGTQGWKEQQPFDRIIVTAGAPGVPDPLLEQLEEDGGVLMIPVGAGLGQELLRVRSQNGQFVREELGACSFVRLIGEEGW